MKWMIDITKVITMLVCGLMAWSMNAAGQEEIYKLPFDNVMECSMMPDMQHALIITRTPLLKPEYAIVRDLKQGKNLWKINIGDRNLQTTVTREGVIVSGELTPKKPTVNLYETQSGKKRYQLQIIPVYINEEDNVVMGYKKKTSKQLECYQLSTGELMWKADATPNKYGIWNGHIRISPHRLVAIADDLLLIDTEKGVLNRAPLKTDITYLPTSAVIAAAVSTMIGMGMGTVTGTYTVTIPLGAKLGSINSNVLVDNDAIYVSDRKGLYCYDTELNEKWIHEFPAKTACHADIRVVGDTLVILNEGYGVYEDIKARYKGLLVAAGEMFYATYNPQTGEEFSFDPIKGQWNMDQFGEHLTIETESFYVPNAEKTELIPVYRPAKSLAIYDKNDQLLVVDNSDATIATIPSKEVFLLTAKNERCMIFANQKKDNGIYVTDLHRKVLRHIEANYISLALKGDKLVVVTTQEVRIYELQNI